MSLEFWKKVKICADKVGIKSNTFSNWKSRGGVPAINHHNLLSVAEELEVPLTREELNSQ